ncbi:MAG: ribosome biogenesis GTPase YlqF, partial [Clostridia bacterium]|nr:ribosome biogenesis GTPase YlqF [Clostridia bacterium]
ILLNKCDMADPAVTDMWIKHYKDEGVTAIPVDCRTGKGLNVFKTTVKDILSDKLAQYREKGMVGKPLRVMVVGIPNVGKSSFINRMVGASRAKVENRPGVTRGNQWFKIDNELELLDTPGVLWPKLDDALAGEYLAFTGAVKDDVLDIEWLAVRLLEVLSDKYMDLLTKTYGIEKDEPYEMLCAFAKKRGMLIRGGEYDTERAANILMAEFRTQKIGRITLEVPNA